MIRTIVSALLFVVFTMLAVAAIVTQRQDYFMWLVPVAIGSILLLPRQTMPEGEPESEEEVALAQHLQKMRLWLAYTRVVYLVTTLFILFGLPSLL